VRILQKSHPLIAHNFKFIIRVPGPNRNPLGGPRNCKPKLRAR
jgi:hypothetical protein